MSAWLAIDIEKLGDHQNAHIIAIGMCLGDPEGNIIKSKAWYIKPDGELVIEPRCKEEFWDKQPDLLAFFLERGSPAKDVYSDIHTWLLGLESQYAKIAILTDNPAYDLSGFDRLMYKYTRRLPLRYTTDDKYRYVGDYSEQSTGMGIYKQVREKATKLMDLRETDKHHPEKDAEFIYRCSYLVSQVLTKGGKEIAKVALSYL